MMFRIQKLLLAEFDDIYEPVIVENPFTQVDEKGIGIRQYQIGLTPTRIFFACDDFDLTDMTDVGFREFDAEIETLSLVSLIPLQILKFHFVRKNGREMMILDVIGDESKTMLFEFGGHYHKSLFWNTWRERVASIKHFNSRFYHISNASPFSSTDELYDDVVCHAVVHAQPTTPSLCYSSIRSQ